jgi:hypothetical protein
VGADGRDDGAADADEGVDVGRRGVLAASQAPQQRRPQEQNEDGGDAGGDDDLEPDRCPEDVGDQPCQAADAEHQEGEIEREHLDDEEDEDQDEPAYPRPLLDGLDELHGAPPLASNLAGRVAV